MHPELLKPGEAYRFACRDSIDPRNGGEIIVGGVFQEMYVTRRELRLAFVVTSFAGVDRLMGVNEFAWKDILWIEESVSR